jgi:hypothetical protein
MLDENRDNSDSRYDRAALLVVVIAIVVAGALVFFLKAQRIFNTEKAWELFTQFFFVAVLGGAVGFAYRRWEATRAEKKELLEKKRETRTVQRALLQEFYRSFVDLHNEYKRIRRTLNARSLQDPNGRRIERGKFEQLMIQLEDCQLRAESLKRQVDGQVELFAKEHGNLSRYLTDIEGYLRKLLENYEEGYASPQEMDNNALIPIGPAVESFIGSRRKNPSVLFDSADGVFELLLKLIERTTPKFPRLR